MIVNGGKMKVVLCVVSCAALFVACGNDNKDKDKSKSENRSAICANFCSKGDPSSCDISKCEEGCNAEEIPSQCNAEFNKLLVCASQESFSCGSNGDLDIKVDCKAQEKSYEQCIRSNVGSDTDGDSGGGGEDEEDSGSSDDSGYEG